MHERQREEDSRPDAAVSAPAALLPVDAVAPDRVRVWQDAFHRVHVRVDDQVYESVRPRRLFPLSRRADYVSFLDGKDREVVLLEHPRKLDAESRRALRHALGRMYYRARILQVYEIREIHGGVCLWRVRTDRGHASFEVTERNDRVTVLPPGRYLITDVDGNRFEIEDIRALDPQSQAEVFHET